MTNPGDGLDDSDESATVHTGVELPEPDGLLPVKPFKGTPLWRRLVAVLGLSAFTMLGGIVIAVTIAALIATAAVVLQLVIS